MNVITNRRGVYRFAAKASVGDELVGTMNILCAERKVEDGDHMISNQSEIDPKAEIDEGVTIGPWCYRWPRCELVRYGNRVPCGNPCQHATVMNNRFYQFCLWEKIRQIRNLRERDLAGRLVTTMCSGKGSRCIEGPVPERVYQDRRR